MPFPLAPSPFLIKKEACAGYDDERQADGAEPVIPAGICQAVRLAAHAVQ